MRKLLWPFFWLLALLGLIKLGAAFQSSSDHFFGIVENQEQIIRFQYPVEIIQTWTQPGKQVQQGEPLLTVKRQSLASSQSILNEQIKQVELKKQEAERALISQIENLKAKKKALFADMDYQIHILELRTQQNNALLNSISERSVTPTTEPLPEVIELIDLKRKRLFSAQAIQVEIDHLSAQINTRKHPIDAEISALQENKTELQRQDTELNVSAQFAGQIGAVNYKAGELVAAFEPIISLHSLMPRDIKGYIHESISNNVKVGQTVWLTSFNPEHKSQFLTGIVESLGNRIVEYPNRLQVNQSVGAWGREVVVQLNEQHQLLFGEKVEIFLTQPDRAFDWLKLVKW